MKKFVLSFIVLSLMAAFLAACGGTAGSCGSSSNSGGNGGMPTVHMCGNNFAQSSITISKGQR
jgi:predicted small secreted protein